MLRKEEGIYYFLGFRQQYTPLRGFWQGGAHLVTSKRWCKRKTKKEDAGFIKMCKRCGAILPPSAKQCPYCEAPIEKRKDEILAELALLTPHQKRSKDLETKVPWNWCAKTKLMNGFYVLHNLTDISEARQFCKMMGYSPYFEQVNRHRFKVFQQ